VTDSSPTTELQAICDVCVQPIDDGEGAVWVEPPSPERQRDTHSPNTPDDLLQPARNRVAWRITHDECAQPRYGYRIEVERIRTWAAYLHWTGHLMGKDWITDTDWDALVLDSLNPTSTNPTGIRPLTLRDLGHRNVGD
jgi:hypothetical protein